MLHLPLETSADELSTFLKQENSLLKEMKATQVQSNFPEKQQLMKNYEDCSLKVRENSHDFQSLDLQIKKSIAEKISTLNELLNENAHLTKRILDAHTYYLETVKSTARKRLGIDVDAYTQTGKKLHPGALNNKYGANAHIALDRAL